MGKKTFICDSVKYTLLRQRYRLCNFYKRVPCIYAYTTLSFVSV